MQWKWKACCQNVKKLVMTSIAEISYIADTPGNCALLVCSRALVCLAFDAFSSPVSVVLHLVQGQVDTHKDP
jgi:hypothetical protein